MTRAHALARKHNLRRPRHFLFTSRTGARMSAVSPGHRRAAAKFAPGAAMPLFAASTDLSCSICEGVYLTANDAFVLSCSDSGCKAMLCIDCMQKAVFASTTNREKLCPHCRRPATSYSYAFFSVHSALRDKVFAKEAEADRLKKRLAGIKIDAELAVRRLQAWQAWAATSESALLAMPPTETQQPPAVVSPPARSRSPRRDAQYAEHNG